jgi:biotin transporter BioY
MRPSGKYVFGYVLGYVLAWLLDGWLIRRHEKGVRAMQCRLVTAAGGLYTMPCPGCGGNHR